MAVPSTEPSELAGKAAGVDPEKLKHRLQIVSKVGRGAFGTVYKGEDAAGTSYSANASVPLVVAAYGS
jgi:hypothetical protein